MRNKLIIGMAVVFSVFTIRGISEEQETKADDAGVVRFSVHAEKTREPISPYIYGQFIEHLGRCIYGGIWAEMLEDRKFFFPVTPEYRPYRKLENTPFPVVGASPWEITGPADGVEMVREDSFVGEHTPLISAGSGIRQKDLGAVKGRKYSGSIWLKSKSGKAGPVNIVFVPEDSPGKQQVHTIKRITDRYEKYEFTFKAGVTTDKAMLEVQVRGEAPVFVGTLSLMPADNINGMRADTLKLLKELNAPIYRWPGGNFVSGYNWRDGIGDRDRRPPRKNPAWTGVEHNDVGLDEFITFCREVNAEPMIAVNTGFGDAYSAGMEVEYCNGTSKTAGGALRKQNGNSGPYSVKYWCVGNEMFGPWQLGFMQLSHYVLKHNETADAMWAADPSIRLVGVGNLGGFNKSHDPGQKVGWTEGMLGSCAEKMNYISEHFYCGRLPWVQDKSEKTLSDHIGDLRKNIRTRAEGHRTLQEKLGLLPDRKIPIAMDEWNYWHDEYVFGELGCVYDLSDALGVALGLHEYFRNTDIIQMAHYAQTVNVIGCIKTTKTEAFFDATAYPLMLYRNEFGTIPVQVEGLTDDRLDVSAAWTENKKELTIGIVNTSLAAINVKMAVTGTDIKSKAETWVISGEKPDSKNAPGVTAVKAEEGGRTDLAGQISIPPLSVHLYKVSAK